VGSWILSRHFGIGAQVGNGALYQCRMTDLELDIGDVAKGKYWASTRYGMN
jgi:hypothetical protein